MFLLIRSVHSFSDIKVPSDKQIILFKTYFKIDTWVYVWICKKEDVSFFTEFKVNKPDTFSYRIFKTYYPTKNRLPDTIYWSCVNPKDIVQEFLFYFPDSKAYYTNRGRYGFIKISSSENIVPLILTFLRHTGSNYNYSFPKKEVNVDILQRVPKPMYV